MYKDQYLCFVDNAKSFEKVIELLGKLNLYRVDIRIFRNTCWGQTPCMWIGNKLNKYTKIKQDMKQGCIFSPDLLHQGAVRQSKENGGDLPRCTTILTSPYADDTMLMLNSNGKLQNLEKVGKESKMKGLTINYMDAHYLLYHHRSMVE